MIDYSDSRGMPCNMIDGCYPPTNEQEAYDLLSRNFERHYTSTSRAPFPMSMHAVWFQKYPFALSGKYCKESMKSREVKGTNPSYCVYVQGYPRLILGMMSSNCPLDNVSTRG